MFAAMLMALSTGPTPYHLCILILTAALGLDTLLAQGRTRQACGLLILYGVTCFPVMLWVPRNADGWHMLIASPRVYPLLTLAFYLYGTTFGLPLVREWLRAHRRETWAFGLFFLVLGAAGVVQAVRHERGQFNNYSHRIFTLPGSLLRGEPALGADGLFVTRMPGNNPAFETWLWSKGQLTPLPPAEDEFHPASAPTLNEVWIEQVGPVSNIVRFSNFDRPGGPTAQIEVANGEQPSVSPDGRTLAFLREHEGRGELWTKDLTPAHNSPPAPNARWLAICTMFGKRHLNPANAEWSSLPPRTDSPNFIPLMWPRGESRQCLSQARRDTPPFHPTENGWPIRIVNTEIGTCM